MFFILNPTDPDFASCDVPEEIIPKKVHLEIIESRYSIGSILWARLDGYPWWPAIVDECPDLLKFCLLQGSSIVPVNTAIIHFRYSLNCLPEKSEYLIAFISKISIIFFTRFKKCRKVILLWRFLFERTEISSFQTQIFSVQTKTAKNQKISTFYF